MNKIFIISVNLISNLITAIIKNSTKKIEDIFLLWKKILESLKMNLIMFN